MCLYIYRGGEVMAFLLGVGIVFAMVLVLVAIAVYILVGISHMKALNALGYDKAWLVWIPLVGSYYACADVASQKQESVTLFGSVQIPSVVFKFWWVVLLLKFIAPLATLATIVACVARVILLGSAYSTLYARLEGRTEQDTLAVGLVSGFLPIVAVVKFFMI